MLGVSRSIRKVSMVSFIKVADGVVFALRPIRVVIDEGRVDLLEFSIRLDIEPLLS